MARLPAILLVVWALFTAPTLCLGGLLEHSCDCESEAQCQHEDSCPGDPCSDVVTHKNGAARIAAPVSCALAAASIWQGPLHGRDRSLRSLPPPGPPDLPRLACAPSDRPLRI